MSATATMIGEVPIFELMDDNERADVGRRMDCGDSKKGDVILEYGDPGGEIFILRNGNVEVFVQTCEGEKIVRAENEQGDVLGELSFLDGGHRTATAVAHEDTQMLSMHRDRLLDFIDKHPHAAIDLLTVVGRRLRATDELLRTHVSRNVNIELQESMTFGERVADKVAAFCGSLTFIMTFPVLMVVWVILNTAALFSNHFDSFPFIFFNLFFSMIGAIPAPVIII